MDEKFLYLFGLAKRNSLLMLRSRGYLTRSPLQPFEEMSAIYTRALGQRMTLAEAATETFNHPNGSTLTVWFVDRNFDPLKRKDKMISTDQIKAVLEDPRPKLVVLPTKLSPQARKEAGALVFFTFEQLIIAIPDHIYYVPHEPTTHDDKEHLPQICESDPVVRWFGFPKGTVLKISRYDGPVYKVVQ